MLQDHSLKSLKNFNPNKVPISLYIHLPWCEKRCPYCDFNINTNKLDGDEERLLVALNQDLKDSMKYIQKRKFCSIYFGGGTPSLVSSKIIKKIIKNLKDMNLLKGECEISFELNPKEVSESYLNKIIAAVLLVALLVIGIGKVSNILFYVEKPKTPGYAVEVEQVSGNSITTTEVVEKVVDIAALMALGDVASGEKIFKKLF